MYAATGRQTGSHTRRITFASTLAPEEVARLLWDDRRLPFTPAGLVVGDSSLGLSLKKETQALRATANWKRVRAEVVVSGDDRASRYTTAGLVVTLDPDVAGVFAGTRQANGARRALEGVRL